MWIIVTLLCINTAFAGYLIAKEQLKRHLKTREKQLKEVTKVYYLHPKHWNLTLREEPQDDDIINHSLVKIYTIDEFITAFNYREITELGWIIITTKEQSIN